ncbi:MAG: hypothetical protein AAGM22_05060 [Acidobacteriota bacterium]
MPDEHTTTDLIEAYLDGELSEAERRGVLAREAEDPHFAEELALARRIQSGLRSMAVECPPEVVTAVVSRTAAPSWTRRLVDLVTGGPSGQWRPALVSVAAALALLVVFSGDLLRPRPAEPTPPAAPVAQAAPSTAETVQASEVEAAQRDIELAFAYLGQLGRTAESSVRRLRTEPPRSDDGI